MAGIQLVVVIAVLCALSASAFRLPGVIALKARSRVSSSLASGGDAYDSFREKLKEGIASKGASGQFPKDQLNDLMAFMDEYVRSGREANVPIGEVQHIVMTFVNGVQEAVNNPYKFSPFHKAIRAPFDYYKWGNDFMRTLIIKEQSRVLGVEQLRHIQDAVDRGENVVIFSNHQTEADPPVVSMVMEDSGFKALAEKVICVAGHKVTNDPVAIPFSMGRNLLCIHSKKHIKNPPEHVAQKQAQNLESMQALGALASAGGNVFWVAPSGGRDRPDPETGRFVVAPFDGKVLDMFKIIAAQSQKPMHFFPMAMYTHKLIPPPNSVSSGVGEVRSAKRGGISVQFLPETDGLGGFKDSAFTQKMEDDVKAVYHALEAWHDQQDRASAK